MAGWHITLQMRYWINSSLNLADVSTDQLVGGIKANVWFSWLIATRLALESLAYMTSLLCQQHINHVVTAFCVIAVALITFLVIVLLRCRIYRTLSHALLPLQAWLICLWIVVSRQDHAAAHPHIHYWIVISETSRAWAILQSNTSLMHDIAVVWVVIEEFVLSCDGNTCTTNRALLYAH